MPRKKRGPTRSAPKRVAPTFVTPFVGSGDVLTLFDVETWAWNAKRTRLNALLFVVCAALAACARVRPPGMIQLLLADYQADRLTLSYSNRGAYPVILLPVVRAAIDAYLAHRRDLGIGGKHLLVDERGNQVSTVLIYAAFGTLARLCGHAGGKVLDRLVAFHDLQLANEKRDLAACVALRRGRRGSLDDMVAIADIKAATEDRERLARVLARNHEFAGKPGRWLGGHGRAKARKEGKLFLRAPSVRQLSPAVRTDPVCARLLALDWRSGPKGQRKKIVDKDLPDLFRLLEAGTLALPDLSYLLNCSPGRRDQIIRKHRRSLETAEERRAREQADAFWEVQVVALHRARPPGEAPHAFFQRLVAEAGYPYGWMRLMRTLMLAGLMPAQVARRRKRRPAGFPKKSKKIR